MLKCKNCGNTDEFIYRAQCDDFILVSHGGRVTDDAPQWAFDGYSYELCDPDPEERPIGCPKCRAWGEHNFDEESDGPTP